MERFYVAILRHRAFTTYSTTHYHIPPQSQTESPTRRYRAEAGARRSTAQLQIDARPSRVLHATVSSNLGPARKHTAN